jgi:hypothetical protein
MTGFHAQSKKGLPITAPKQGQVELLIFAVVIASEHDVPVNAANNLDSERYGIRDVGMLSPYDVAIDPFRRIGENRQSFTLSHSGIIAKLSGLERPPILFC